MTLTHVKETKENNVQSIFKQEFYYASKMSCFVHTTYSQFKITFKLIFWVCRISKQYTRNLKHNVSNYPVLFVYNIRTWYVADRAVSLFYFVEFT